MGTVASNLTSITTADAGTWADIGGGAGSTANADIFIQGTGSRGRRGSNVTDHGFWVNNGSGIDLSNTSQHVGLWIWHTHYVNLTKLAVRLGGTSTTNYDEHSFGPSNYPATGGWIRVWVHVNRTPDATGGSGLTESAVQHFGAVFSCPSVGGNAQNEIIDAIDYTTTGLTITGTSGLWSDFVTSDNTNKYGVIIERDAMRFVLGRLTLGTASSLVFNDANFVIVFPNQGLVKSDFMGVTVDLQNASTNVDWTDGVLKSAGAKQGDLVVTGTSGTFDAVSVTLDGMRVITLTSKCTLTTCKILNSGLITQSSAILSGCSIKGTAGNTSVLSNDPSKISGCTFTSAGTGHAIELNTAGTFNFTDNLFSGYGSDGTTDACIYNNSGGAITINVLGTGTTPTIRNGTGASTTIVAGTVTTTITVRDINSGSAISGARVLITAADATGTMPFQKSTTITRSGSTATATCASHGLVDGKKVLIKGAVQQEYNGVFTATVTGANTFTYTVSGTPATPATGTIVSTGVVIDGTTDGSGVISDTRTHATDQPITGRVRKATSGTLYKTGVISGTVDSATGFSATVQLIPDQ